MEPRETAADEALMKRYLAGDYSAFEALYQRHSARAYGYLRRKLDRKEDADEVLQAAFLKLHQFRDGYDAKYPFAQWLFVVVRSSLLDHLRKRGRQVKIADDVAFDEVLGTEITEEKQLSDLEILADISPEQRQAIELRILDDLSYEQIAEKLGKSQVTVRQLVSRGLKKLRAAAGLAAGGMK